MLNVGKDDGDVQDKHVLIVFRTTDWRLIQVVWLLLYIAEDAVFLELVVVLCGAGHFTSNSSSMTTMDIHLFSIKSNTGF
jgi:hypothetical protein